VIALENAAIGITCNAICPGFVLTPLIQQQIDLLAAANGCSADEAARRLLAGKHPSGRSTRAEDIAALTLFLCGPAAANITGACLPIDGGWTAQ
jgi:3-hydroxybutyrate dehydrogenase